MNDTPAGDTAPAAGSWKPCAPANPFVFFTEAETRQDVARRFEQQAARTPERLAVQDRGRAWSYDALNRRVNRLAHGLLALSGRPEEPVALLLEHGAPAILGMLGVWKAGRLYVPIDPRSPPERIRLLLTESQATAIVVGNTTKSLLDGVPHCLGIINVDTLEDGLSEANLQLTIPPDALGAVYYTSGSTGGPKGVIFTHRLFLRYARDRINVNHISAEDRVSLVFSYAFIASLSDILCALLTGATVIPYDIPTGGLALLGDWLEEQRITCYHCVPTTFRNFMGCIAPERRFSSIRLVTLTGETIRAEDVRLFKARFADHCLLRFSMGLTEAGGVAARMVVDKRVEPGDGPVPVGYAMDGLELLIVDENGQRLGPEEVGEIVLRGHYLSPGYWRRPDLTRAAFRDDPDGSGARMYYTGDLGSLASDGCLTHRGRKDLQVKIRGQRVELSEVEAALLRSPGIREAVAAVAPDGASGGDRIVAYVVPTESPAPTVSRIRAALAAALPEYMIPTSFVFLDALPLLAASGKVDRRALPGPPAVRPPLDNVCTPPRNALEDWLTGLWEDVLGVRPIGVQDNFLELGGHSLSAARLFAEIEEAFGKSMPLPLLLQAPTIEQLAAAIKQDGGDEQGTLLMKIQTKGSRPPLFCVDALGAGNFVHLARELGPDQPCYGLHFFDHGERGVTIESLAAQYVFHVRALQSDGPYYLCGLCNGGVLAYEMAQQLLAAGQRVAWLALFDAFIPKRGILPLVLQRMIRRWKGRGERLAQRAADGSCSTAPVNRQLLRLKRCEHENRRIIGRAVARYQPESYPGRVHLFLAERKEISEAQDSRLAWGNLAKGGAEALTVPGTHQSMLHEPHIAVLAGHVRRCLEAARQRGS
jgi:amino acid adenylation domain-containing protein